MNDNTSNDSAARELLQRRLAFLKITNADSEALRGDADVMMRRLEGSIDAVYEHLIATGKLNHLLENDGKIARLKSAQLAYYQRMVDANLDEEYLENRVNIGRVHERVGLEPEWYLGTYALLFNEWVDELVHHHDGDSQATVAALQAMTKVVFFDMTAAIDTYIQKREETNQKMVDEFTGTLSGYLDRLNQTTTGIKGATTSQTEAAQRQAAAVAEITTAMAELSQTAKQALGQAESVMQTTEHTIGVARDGKQAVAEVSTGMEDIRQQMETLSERVLLLNEQTQQIGDIISSVSEISEQSKLLALNAAIEAARAGEHGRGFAVVATEIRNLADQSKQSTVQVGSILGDIQKATDAAVLATEQGTLAVEKGASLASTAGERFNELADAVEESGESARLIATVSRQQGEGIEQISVAMDEINKNSVESADGMRTIESGTGDLSDLADNIQGVLSMFVDEDDDAAPVQSKNQPPTEAV